MGSVKLEQKNDGSWKKSFPRRKFPKMLESVVDKSNFKPNVNDARQLLSSDKIGGNDVKLLYDYTDGRTTGPNHAWMRNRLDITEIDKELERQSKEAQKMLKKAKGKAIEEAQKNAEEIAMYSQNQAKGGTNQVENQGS